MIREPARSLRRPFRSALWLGALLALACSAPKPKSQVPAGPSGVLLPSGELGPPFMVEQRLTGKHGTQDVAFDCVVQLSEGKLTVIGLTPFRTRAFVVEQRGMDVRYQKYMLRDVPFEPVHVLYDIHRVFFRGLRPPRTDGTHEQQDHGDLVRERWQGGHLVERRFEALEGPFSNLVVVSFEGAPAPVIAPRVRLTNVAYGYSLEIENLEQKLLEPRQTLEVEKKPAE